MELEECDVIEHLIDFTEAAAADPVILEQAMVEIPEEGEPEDQGERSRKSSRSMRTVVKETSKRDIQHPKPSLCVTINLRAHFH